MYIICITSNFLNILRPYAYNISKIICVYIKLVYYQNIMQLLYFCHALIRVFVNFKLKKKKNLDSEPSHLLKTKLS